MTCTTCTPRTVARQQARAQSADSAIDAKFGRYMEKGTRRKNSKVEVLDEADMQRRWAEVRVEEWKKEHPPPTDPTAMPAYEKDLAAQKEAFTAVSQQLSVEAFAHGDTAYVTPDSGHEVVAHELLHNKASAKSTDYLLASTEYRNANNLAESMTEHFNAQVTGGVAIPGGASYTEHSSSQYGTGANVVRELRDERLGGPVAGEEVLRKFYFGGDIAGFEKATASSGGPPAFFDEYRKRTFDYTSEAWKKTLK